MDCFFFGVLVQWKKGGERMFRHWLREARESFGLTQGELGRLVGISPSALGMYEQGRRRPGPKSRARIREFFRERGVEMPPPGSGDPEGDLPIGSLYGSRL